MKTRESCGTITSLGLCPSCTTAEPFSARREKRWHRRSPPRCSGCGERLNRYGVGVVAGTVTMNGASVCAREIGYRLLSAGGAERVVGGPGARCLPSCWVCGKKPRFPGERGGQGSGVCRGCLADLKGHPVNRKLARLWHRSDHGRRMDKIPELRIVAAAARRVLAQNGKSSSAEAGCSSPGQ